jgi:hypothetical protein
MLTRMLLLRLGLWESCEFVGEEEKGGQDEKTLKEKEKKGIGGDSWYDACVFGRETDA